MSYFKLHPSYLAMDINTRINLKQSEYLHRLYTVGRPYRSVLNTVSHGFFDNRLKKNDHE